MQVSIKEVENGFVVNQQDNEHVFNSFDGMVRHLRAKMVKPEKVLAPVISLEDRYPQAFRDGMD